VGNVVLRYVHPTVTCEQVVRLGMVEKTISSVGVFVVIWAKVRQGGAEKKQKITSTTKLLPGGIGERYDRFRRNNERST